MFRRRSRYFPSLRLGRPKSRYDHESTNVLSVSGSMHRSTRIKSLALMRSKRMRTAGMTARSASLHPHRIRRSRSEGRLLQWARVGLQRSNGALTRNRGYIPAGFDTRCSTIVILNVRPEISRYNSRSVIVMAISHRLSRSAATSSTKVRSNS